MTVFTAKLSHNNKFTKNAHSNFITSFEKKILMVTSNYSQRFESGKILNTYN